MKILAVKKLFEYPILSKNSSINDKYLRYVPKTLQPYVIWLDVYKDGRTPNIQFVLQFDGVEYTFTPFESIDEMKYYLSNVLKDYRSGELVKQVEEAKDSGSYKIHFDF